MDERAGRQTTGPNHRDKNSEGLEPFFVKHKQPLGQRPKNHPGHGQPQHPHRRFPLRNPAPAQAKALLERFEFIYTPKHGSWLNMAEIEINSLIQQCLNRRIGDMEEMRTEVTAWQREQNQAAQMIRWHFTTDDARIKLHRLYPTFED